MNSLREFFNMFFTTDYFLILLIILLLVLLVITIHLIKVENYYKKNKNNLNELNDDILEDQDDNTLVLNFGNENNDYKDSFKEISPRLQDKFDNIEKILSDKNEKEIEKYENDEEKSAIISTEELESLSKDKGFEIGNNKNLIIQYEEEQEKKAIISYEELLKNASSLKVSYKDETNNENGPIVRKIELEKPNIERNLNYIEETNFLSTLKDFRANLK